MIERFEPQKLSPDDIRIDYTFTDRCGDVVGVAGKRFVGIWEDRRQGFRITVEGSDRDEVEQEIARQRRNVFD